VCIFGEEDVGEAGIGDEGEGEGRSEKREGEGAMKDRYWSRTWLNRRKVSGSTVG
jgi:hypothetical protein